MKKIIAIFFVLFVFTSTSFCADKTFPPATDIEMSGEITIYKHGSQIEFRQDYYFLDAAGNRIFDKKNKINVEVNFQALPQDIRDALISIQAKMKSLALDKEGM